LRKYSICMGMQCDVVATAHEAVQLATKNVYDLFIVDLNLPDLDSFAFPKLIKSTGQGINKLILCSSFDYIGLGEKALESGFSAFLLKPIKQSHFFDCVDNVLTNAKPQAFQLTAAASQEPQGAIKLSAEDLAANLILVAEDNPVNQKVALLLLKELGLDGHVAASGREAVDALACRPYALVLMDCQMPDMDGFDATLAIRKAEAFTGKHIPIVALTAHAMHGDRERCIASGMDDYISKPVTSVKLKETLAKYFPLDELIRNKKPIAAKTKDQLLTELLRPRGSQMASLGKKEGQDFTPEKPDAKKKWPIQIDRLEESCGADGACEILGIFLNSTKSLLDDLERAINERNSKTVGFFAHELKGACSSLGADEMAFLSKELEDAALKESWSAAQEFNQKVKHCFEDVEIFVRPLVESHSLSPTK
jgi:two-component system sensor histidine kinase/response regulator